MKKISFDFLATMPLKEIDKSPLNLNGGKTPVEGADFRLFVDGSIHPSQERVVADELEFQPKDSGQPEFGYDIFLSTDWHQYDNIHMFPCISKVSKHAAKVDLFGRLKYNPDGTPKSSIHTVKTTGGLELIGYLEKSYCTEGESLFGNSTFIDLKVRYSTPLKETATKIYNIPKVVAKGKDVGKVLYERRENIKIYPIEPMSLYLSKTSATTATPGLDAQVKAEIKHRAEAVSTSSEVPSELAAKLFGV